MAKGKKDNRKDGDFRLLDLRMKIAHQYMEGYTQQEIAKGVNLSIAAVSNHLQKIREYWLSLMMADFDEKKSREMAKIDHLERIAFRAWKRSTRPTQTRQVSTEQQREVVYPRDKEGKIIKGKAPTVKMVVGKQVDDTKEVTSAGDPRFLQIIDKCIEKRLKIMGALEESSGGTIINLNFGDLLRQKQQEPTKGDIIENIIAQVGHRLESEMSNEQGMGGNSKSDNGVVGQESRGGDNRSNGE